MRLSRRLTLMLVVLATVVLATLQTFEVSREVRLASQNTEHDHLLLGHTLVGSFARAWQLDGPAEAHALLSDASRFEGLVNARWVWLDRDGLPFEAAELAPLRRGQSVSLVDRHASPRRRVTFTPLSIDGRLGAIELSESLAAEAMQVRQTVIGSLVATSVMATLFMIAAGLLGKRLIGEPVHELARVASLIGAGDYTARVQLPHADELTELGVAFNEMTQALRETRTKLDAEREARIATLEHLRHADRLATVGKLAAGVAHELGTPINVIHGRARLIERGEVQGEGSLQSARIIAEQAEALTRIIRQLLDFARRSVPSRAPHELRGLVESSVALLRPLADARRIALELAPGGKVVAEVDPAQLQQVISNLVVNGLHATPKFGAVRLRLVTEQRAPPPDLDSSTATWARLDVEDTGAGIAPEVLPRIFEPFFTTKGVGEGTGLGLSVVYGLIREHGGWVEVKSGPNQAACFSTFLPVAPAGATG